MRGGDDHILHLLFDRHEKRRPDAAIGAAQDANRAERPTFGRPHRAPVVVAENVDKLKVFAAMRIGLSRILVINGPRRSCFGARDQSVASRLIFMVRI